MVSRVALHLSQLQCLLQHLVHCVVAGVIHHETRLLQPHPLQARLTVYREGSDATL